MDEFIDLYKRLDKQCNYYSRHLGHLKGVIGNDDWMRVVDGSISGRALLLGNSEITIALVLFNTRMLDPEPDTITVHKLARNLPTEQEIENFHSLRMQDLGIKYKLDKYLSARNDFTISKRNLSKNRIHSKLRSLRNYTLAHNIEPKTELEKATLNDLIEVTEATLDLVDLAGYIVTSSKSVYRDFSAQSEKETRMLLAALPSLSKTEKE